MAEPELPYKVHHDYTLLGYDLDAGTLDMVVCWQGDGGHCVIHRHTATTTILVFEGEQHLWDLDGNPDRGLERKHLSKLYRHPECGDGSSSTASRGRGGAKLMA